MQYMQYNASQQLQKLQFQCIIAITIITTIFNIVSFTAYRPIVKVDCSAWGMSWGQGHRHRRHFHSQQHGKFRT